MPRTDQYTYPTLQAACTALGTQQNVYGCLVDCSETKATQGTDLMCTMTIVDSSTYCVHDGGTSGLDVRLFFSKEEDRPHPRARCGDIIRFHRLKVESYKGTCSLVGKVGKYCHFLMFDGACETETPYQASSPTYTLTNVDKISLERLRTWIRSLNLSSLHTNQLLLQTKHSQYLREIKDITGEEYFDIIGKVLHVGEYCGTSKSGAQTKCKIIHLWDGSDAPCVACPPFASSHRTRLELEYSHVIYESQGFDPSFDASAVVPMTGSTVPLLISSPSSCDLASIWSAPPGSWIMLRNVTAYANVIGYSAQWQLVFMRNSSYYIVNCGDDDARSVTTPYAFTVEARAATIPYALTVEARAAAISYAYIVEARAAAIPHAYTVEAQAAIIPPHTAAAEDGKKEYFYGDVQPCKLRRLSLRWGHTLDAAGFRCAGGHTSAAADA
ncbi:hypothetical protein CYMTET_51776, partial [Cymbomonas tetramitiformis]